LKNKKVVFAELSLLVITVIWGLGFPITRIAIDFGFGPSTIMLGRFMIAALLLTIVYFKRLKFIDKKIILFGIITGVFLFLGFYFQTVGNVYTTPSKNGFITQLNIVFVPFLFMLFFRKLVDVYNVIAVLIALVGMFVLSYNPTGFSGVNIGDILTFICAIMVAFHIVSASYFQKKYNFDPALFVLVNIVTSFVLSGLLFVFTESLPVVEIKFYWPILFLGVFNTALGFLVQSFALKISLPTRVSLIVALESIFAAVSSYIILNEEMTSAIIFGGALIILGVLINEIKPFSKKKEVL
jgi:drug/metabolite transporter (DMT)-like permease